MRERRRVRLFIHCWDSLRDEVEDEEVEMDLDAILDMDSDAAVIGIAASSSRCENGNY